MSITSCLGTLIVIIGAFVTGTMAAEGDMSPVLLLPCLIAGGIMIVFKAAGGR